MTALTAVPSPAQIPAARQNARLYLQSRALTGIRQHLQCGGTDTEFMLRLAANTLRETAPSGSDGIPDPETRRHTRGLEALKRHLTVGGTDRAILIGLAENALTGYSPATEKEANEMTQNARRFAA
jgi:hypothetical protein